MTKQEIRTIVLQKRQQTGKAWIESTSRVIQEQVLGLPEFETARVVCAYVAVPSEVRTDLIRERTWAEGKQLCVPARCAPGHGYGLAELTRDATLVSGPMRVPQPAQLRWIDIDAVGLMIVPGVGFDERGGRVGHGGGHYDRILGRRKKTPFFTVGLAFQFQIFDSVPVEATDVRLGAVITE